MSAPCDLRIVRVVLPAHLRTIAKVNGEVNVEVAGEVTLRSVLDSLERQYPALEGTIRDHVTRQRRAFVRFFACAEDWSHEPVDIRLPEKVVKGDEPLLVVAAIAGGSAQAGSESRVAKSMVNESNSHR